MENYNLDSGSRCTRDKQGPTFKDLTKHRQELFDQRSRRTHRYLHYFQLFDIH